MLRRRRRHVPGSACYYSEILSMWPSPRFPTPVQLTLQSFKIYAPGDPPCEGGSGPRRARVQQQGVCHVKISSFQLFSHRELPEDFAKQYKSVWVEPPFGELARPEQYSRFYHWSIEELV